MTSISPAFLPAGEDPAAAPKNTMHACTRLLVWDKGQISVGELGLDFEILQMLEGLGGVDPSL